jgi:hypothetical protein
MRVMELPTGSIIDTFFAAENDLFYSSNIYRPSNVKRGEIR